MLAEIVYDETRFENFRILIGKFNGDRDEVFVFLVNF